MKKVHGEGTDLSNTGRLNNRAKKKLITQKRTLSLIDVAKNKGYDFAELKPYWNTFKCLNKVISANGRLYGIRHCKNRFCTVCCGIRKAEIIRKYLPAIKKWKDPHFVTLTVQSVKANKLNGRVDEMFLVFNKFKDKYRKWHSRDKRVIRFVGIKSFECNYNPVKNTYNPHFHFIVQDEVTAKLLQQEWQKYWGYKMANSLAQDITKVTNPEMCLIEIIKYGAKTFTDPDMIKKKEKNKPTEKKTQIIYAAALHNILCAMKGHRIFERFGFNVPKEDSVKLKKTTLAHIFKEWVYSIQHTDWLCETTEQPLTGYIPTAKLAAQLEYFINKNSE